MTTTTMMIILTVLGTEPNNVAIHTVHVPLNLYLYRNTLIM